MVPGLADLPYEDRLRRFGIQSLKTRRFRADLILIYKMFHGLVDLPVENLFLFDPPGRMRGHHLRLKPAFLPKWNYARFSFSYRVVEHWNRLPSGVVSAPDLASFKRMLHDSGSLPQW